MGARGYFSISYDMIQYLFKICTHIHEYVEIYIKIYEKYKKNRKYITEYICTKYTCVYNKMFFTNYF